MATFGKVDLAALSDDPMSPQQDAGLRQVCERAEVVVQSTPQRWTSATLSFLRGQTATEGLFWSKRLANVLSSWVDDTNYDLIVATCSSMAQYALLPKLKEIPTIVDLIDVDSQKWLDYGDKSRFPKRLLYRTEGFRLRRLEQKIVDHAKAVLLVNEREAELFRHVVPNQRTHAVCNGVDTDYFYRSTSAQNTNQLHCAFIGVLNYRPNEDGLKWFCQSVWPAIIKRYPNASFSIVGKSPSDEVVALGKMPGISIHANVPDVRPYLDQATVVVAPLQIARGTQNKVLEAMAMGKPVIATRQALEGIDLEVGKDALEANAPSEWVSTISRLNENKVETEGLKDSAREFVLHRHNWNSCLKPINDIAKTITESSNSCQTAVTAS